MDEGGRSIKLAHFTEEQTPGVLTGNRAGPNTEGI